MRLAFVTDEDSGLKSRISSRFARAKNIVLVDVDDSWNVVKADTVHNTAAESGSGAGVKIVQTLADLKVDVAVGPSFGPNAALALNEVGIKSVTVPPGITIEEALNEVKEKISG
ncbi:MAG: NifB/NifX family molybdenum-iron cluster-binding protein [Desulfurococcales archaeon]|nr:NifB/NifX family molybdenum-iron cluster-binding protein [Desulfurococcales archaeon]